jgi:hypothetical protein
MTESRTRQRIRRAAESAGREVDWMEWTPVGGMIEMQGPGGGWAVFLTDGSVVTGYNADEVVEALQRG